MPKPRVVMKFGKPYVWVEDPTTHKLVLLPLLPPRDDEAVMPGGVGPMPAVVRNVEVEIRE
jgi:hypothetical protein